MAATKSQRNWTEADDEALTELVEIARMPMKQIAVQIDRSHQAVQTRMRTLDLCYPVEGGSDDPHADAVRNASTKLAERGHPQLMPNLIPRVGMSQPSRPTASCVASSSKLAGGAKTPFALFGSRAP